MKTLLTQGLKTLHIPSDESMVNCMCGYAEDLLEANRTTNLTAIREETSAIQLHFLDSAALCTLADLSGKSIIDIGSGAGFPGVPLAVLNPSSSVTVLDSVGKKMEFVRKACERNHILNVSAVWGRAEEQREMRESFDFAVSRAVAELAVLAELCLPLVCVGGEFLAMKNPDCEEELDRARGAIGQLGGRVEEVARYTIPGTDVIHAVVRIRKVKETLPQFPRRYAAIVKRPLK